MGADREFADARAGGDDGAVLLRMLADADRLCASDDAIVAAQCVQLRGRIAALVDILAPTDLRPEDPS